MIFFSWLSACDKNRWTLSEIKEEMEEELDFKFIRINQRKSKIEKFNEKGYTWKT